MPTPQRGQLYWAHVPTEPSDRRRPVLIVSSDSRNALANDVMVVPITSNMRSAPTHVVIPAGFGGLPHRSAAKCEQLKTIQKTCLHGEPLGLRVPETILRDVVAAVLRAMDVPGA